MIGLKRRRQKPAGPVTGPIEIRGVVIPDNWDDAGAVIGVALSAFDEVNYLIRNDDKGRDLAALLQEEVEVKGDVEEIGNRKVITVRDYHRATAAGDQRRRHQSSPRSKDTEDRA